MKTFRALGASLVLILLFAGCGEGGSGSSGGGGTGGSAGVPAQGACTGPRGATSNCADGLSCGIDSQNWCGAEDNGPLVCCVAGTGLNEVCKVDADCCQSPCHGGPYRCVDNTCD